MTDQPQETAATCPSGCDHTQGRLGLCEPHAFGRSVRGGECGCPAIALAEAREGRAHVPAVTDGRDGEWLVYCPACSNDAGNWVAMCGEWDSRLPWPPHKLRAAASGGET